LKGYKMGIVDIVLIMLASFNVVFSIHILRQGIDCEYRLSKKIFTLAVWIVLISSALYIPSEIGYCNGVKLDDFQNTLRNVYEGLIHVCKFMFLLAVRFRKLEG